MGFFSYLQPELPKQSSESSETTNMCNSSKEYIVEGIKAVAISSMIYQAREFYSGYDLDNSVPFVLFLVGNRHSGKSLLAKAIMDELEVDYSLLDLCAFENATYSIKLFRALASISEGVILEGYDRITDKELKECVNDFVMKKTATRMHTEKGFISPIIIPVCSVKNISFDILRMAYEINVSYKRYDYSMLFVHFLKECGYELKDLNIAIDDEAIELVGRKLKDNIDCFRIWIEGIIKMSKESNETIKLDISNVEETIPDRFPGWSAM